MINSNRPIINLDLELLSTFFAVADRKTFSATQTIYQTQSAVSQQM
ncbi:MAG: LysR family transcriptional regulator, partial [Candidatus Regiella insecticola]|nr:LysR family transcriptional regulator [Candidatus Regiella insecticola]